jgi:hypothetical protein
VLQSPFPVSILTKARSGSNRAAGNRLAHPASAVASRPPSAAPGPLEIRARFGEHEQQGWQGEIS